MADMELVKASKNLENATAQLKDFNQSAGKEIATQIGGDLKKGVLDPFTSAFATIPGVSTLGAVGQTIFNKTFAALKARREENLLRQRLGLTKEQFSQMKYQKSVLDAQAQYSEQLKSGAENLLGINVDEFNIAANRFVDEQGNFTMGVNRFAKEQGDLVALQQAKMDKDDSAASKRIEAENRAEREAAEQRNIFERIAGSIDGLAEGIQNIKAEDVGKGLLAPIGLIGGIIVSFVTGFVAEVTKQFNALKLVATKGVAGFKTVATSLKGLLKAITPNFILATFESIADAVKGYKNIIGGQLKKIPKAIDIAADASKITEPFKSFGRMVGNVKTFFVNSKFFQGILKFGDLLMDGIKAAVKPLQSLFSMIKSTSTSMAAMAGSGGVIGRIMAFAQGFGRVLGRLFLPVTIVMSAFDLITGFIDGFKESEGDSIVSKFIDGVGGGLSKLIGNLIGIPLDLLKKGVGFILGFLGFDDAKKSLESFSFKDLIMDIVKAPFNLVSKAIDYIVGVFTGENNVVEDLISGVANVAEAAKGLLKGILRSILPSPKNEDGGVMGWIKSQVSKVIPDKVYEFAGLDPETGERLLPKASEESLQAISDAGLADAYMQARNTGNADEMERLIRESEMRKQGGAETINVNNYNTDNRSTSQSSTITSTNITDPASMSGASMTMS
tara:strand:- start:171 stop:2186 length:2016 start_codon:yes stop_codon:yes gene_type:complete